MVGSMDDARGCGVVECGLVPIGISGHEQLTCSRMGARRMESVGDAAPCLVCESGDR